MGLLVQSQKQLPRSSCKEEGGWRQRHWQGHEGQRQGPEKQRLGLESRRTGVASRGPSDAAGRHDGELPVRHFTCRRRARCEGTRPQAWRKTDSVSAPAHERAPFATAWRKTVSVSAQAVDRTASTG